MHELSDHPVGHLRSRMRQQKLWMRKIHDFSDMEPEKLSFVCWVGRPERAVVVEELARHLHSPTEADMRHLKRVLRYIKGTQHAVWNLEYDPSLPLSYVYGYADSNWAGHENPKSTSGGMLLIAGMVLASWSKTQSCVALSSCEAELMALNLVATEGQLAVNLLRELDLLPVQKLVLHTDSSSCLKISLKRGCGRMRHLTVKQLWLQDAIRTGALEVEKIDGKLNPVDLLTKHHQPG